MQVGLFSELINRKFQNIAENRYREIVERYREFFLSEEELAIPRIFRVFVLLDRYSEKPNDDVYETLKAYPSARVCLLYVVEESLVRLVASTLGDEEAEKLRTLEINFGNNILDEVESRLKEMKFEVERRFIFGVRAEEPLKFEDDCDLFIISKHYGSETSKTYPVSPMVYRIVQHIEKPIIIY
ncbi:universal stress protein [Thermococcus sp.]|uniref:universal stress protein n=1 Tax=Thermococcus sp. TaxID=35749 RepID=UPI0026161D35|nr:universal stress protein [Thermococcus sp.]